MFILMYYLSISQFGLGLCKTQIDYYSINIVKSLNKFC